MNLKKMLLLSVILLLLVFITQQRKVIRFQMPFYEFYNIPILNILHSNDFYELKPLEKEPKAGAAYFKAMLQRYQQKYNKNNNLLNIFSGDVFSPSRLSRFMQGWNMVQALNSFNIDIAMYGNHQFDFSQEYVLKLANATNFKWLLTNVIDKRTNKPIANGIQYQILQRNGKKYGFIGLADKDWLATIKPFFRQISDFQDYAQVGKKMSNFLKIQMKVDYVIALTHMLTVSDQILAKQVPEIDIILGGHDHSIYYALIQKTLVIKSGSDFKYFTRLSIYDKNQYWFWYWHSLLNMKNEKDSQAFQKNIYDIYQDHQFVYQIELVQINHQKYNIIPDHYLHNYTNWALQKLAEKDHKIAAYTKNQIDVRNYIIRTQQSPYLQFISTFYRHCLGADIGFLNSGNYRSDKIIPPGPIDIGTLTNFMQDFLIVKKMPGRAIMSVLENIVSQYPGTSGRMTYLSGMTFIWNSTRQKYNRVYNQTVKIHGKPIDLQKQYSLVFISFISNGGDDYQVFKQYSQQHQDEDVTNIKTVERLANPQDQKVISFLQKYPHYAKIIQKDGKKFLELDLPKPSNVLRVQ